MTHYEPFLLASDAFEDRFVMPPVPLKAAAANQYSLLECSGTVALDMVVHPGDGTLGEGTQAVFGTLDHRWQNSEGRGVESAKLQRKVLVIPLGQLSANIHLIILASRGVKIA
jgi:hypothetical protein